ncbi:MAG: sugar phosphate isomerase/epimerase family protein [Gammaproteobacteria bacterium]
MSNSDQYAMSRRGLLAGGAALASTALASTALLRATPVQAMAARKNVARAPGIQLYTVRDSMSEDLHATLVAIAAMGYRDVEFAGYFDRSPRELRQIMDDLGLRSPSSHVNAARMRDDPESVIEAAAELGNRFVTIGWLNESDRTSISDYHRWADTLNRAGDVGRKSGVRAAYHNHEFEFEKLDAQLPYDVLIARTEPELVVFELDFFWVAKAGLDVADVLGANPSRFEMAHIKDMDADGNMVDVGSGGIDFTRLLKGAWAASLDYLFVEHDEPANALRTAAVGRQALSQILSKL